MYGVNEAHLPVVAGEDQRMRARSFAEESNAAQQTSARDTRAGEDELFAGSQLIRIVNALGVLDTHLRDALMVLGLGQDEAAQNLPVQAAQSCGGQDAFRRASGAHHGVDACAHHRGADARRKIAV